MRSTAKRLRQVVLLICNTSFHRDRRMFSGRHCRLHLIMCCYIPCVSHIKLFLPCHLCLFCLLIAMFLLLLLYLLNLMLTPTQVGHTDAKQLCHGGNQARQQGDDDRQGERQRKRQREQRADGALAKTKAARGDKADEADIPAQSIDADADRPRDRRCGRPERQHDEVETAAGDEPAQAPAQRYQQHITVAHRQADLLAFQEAQRGVQQPVQDRWVENDEEGDDRTDAQQPG